MPKKRKREQAGVGGYETLEDLYRAVFQGVRAEVEAHLRGDRTEEAVYDLVDTGAEYADQIVETVKEHLPPEAPLACRAGCAWCCHVHVMASIPEVLVLADFLRETLRAEDLEAVRQRVADLDDRTRNMDPDARDRAQLPCPLLVEATCSVYPVRPFACRGWNSLDASECEAYYHDPDPDREASVYLPQWVIAAQVRQGLNAGLAEEGLANEDLDLVAGLRIALETPNAAGRWLAGEPVFKSARIRISKSIRQYTQGLLQIDPDEQ